MITSTWSAYSSKDASKQDTAPLSRHCTGSKAGGTPDLTQRSKTVLPLLLQLLLFNLKAACSLEEAPCLLSRQA